MSQSILIRYSSSFKRQVVSEIESGRFDNINQALLIISNYLDIPIERWIKNSAILKNRLYQKRIEDFN